MISMRTLTISSLKIDRRLCFSLAAVAIMFFFLFGRLNHYLQQSLYESAYYHLGVPALVAIYLAVRGFHDGTEMKILILYVAWAVFSRILNGDRFLLTEVDYLIDLSTMILLFAPGVLLHGKQREKLLHLASGVIVLFFLFMAAVCIYTGITRSFVLNPIDLWGIGYAEYSPKRLIFLSYQWNETAALFVIAFGLCLVLFFRTRNVLIRAGLVIAAAADYIVVGLTWSRNGQTCVCLILGMMFGILAVGRMARQALWKRVCAFFAVCLLVTVLVYQVFEPARYGLWLIGHGKEATTAYEREDTEGTEEENAEEKTAAYAADNRNYLKSGRKKIYRSAFKSLQMEPKRLLIGSGYYHVMDISHTLIKEQAKHFHNTFLQVVNEFGLIGLALVVWFYLRILILSFRMIFRTDERVAAGDKMLSLIPIGLMCFFMLEVGIFKIVDMANFTFTFFYFICGMLTGVAKNLTDRETEQA